MEFSDNGLDAFGSGGSGDEVVHGWRVTTRSQGGLLEVFEGGFGREFGFPSEFSDFSDFDNVAGRK